MDDQFRILVVCTGNVCRSPLAERMIRARLASALGDGAGRFSVTSAGTQPLLGCPMDPRAAATAGAFGADTHGFTSRNLTATDIAEADLVLTATREHRARVVRLHPRAHRYAFTIREFSRLVRSLPSGTVDGEDPVLRARLLVAGAGARRGTVRPRRPEDDDVADPVGGAAHVHRSVGATIADALTEPLEAITGVDHTPVTLPDRDRGESDVSGHHGQPGRPVDPGRPESGGLFGAVRLAGRVTLRWTVRLVILAAAVVLLASGWLAVRGIQAEHELAGARTGLATLRTDLLAGDRGGAHQALAEVARHTRAARRLTDDPIWRAAATPPYLGNTVRAVRAAAAATDELSHHVLPALVDVGGLDPESLRPSGDTVAVGRLRAVAPTVHSAATALSAVSTNIGKVDQSWLLPPVASGFDELRIQLADVSSTLDSVDQAARLVPAMLGADGPRHYLVAFQNNAEARGTGGLLGLYAVVTADHGKLRIDQLGSNTGLRSSSTMPVDLGESFRARWGDDPALWPNSNMDPHFPYAARIWLALWARQTGQHLDGVIATDPVALSYVLEATGPIRLSTGEILSSGNAVALTLSQVYARFPDSNDRRDAYMREVAQQVMGTLLSGRGDTEALLRGLSRAAGERRMLVYSSHRDEERQLADTPLGGTLPDGDGPYAFVVVNNAAGSKMDYYLTRSVRYSSVTCTAGRRQSRIEVTLGNTAPDGAKLPRYVTQREDTDPSTLAQSADPDSVSLLVSVYGPRGAGVVHATVDGHRLGLVPGTEAGRPVWEFPLVVGHGTSRTVVLEITEPASNADPVIPVQPLVLPQQVRTTLVHCD
ncbi:MAG TPA: DUF4012 domain-containing protein [Mycobacteriales bacterium]